MPTKAKLSKDISVRFMGVCLDIIAKNKAQSKSPYNARGMAELLEVQEANFGNYGKPNGRRVTIDVIARLKKAYPEINLDYIFLSAPNMYSTGDAEVKLKKIEAILLRA